ncbi:hypothetical protein [Paenibacillus alkalitolerans]|uniref:hypothetical protein n=1 Tax=Paenibacillus alkalitolerans TaxID=2799335 RepID=UPI0018F28A8C|nr:hypothetical protein [Paenibacillus alkalitolerans]
MRYEGKVVLEVKELLVYLGISFDKWKVEGDVHNAKLQDPTEYLSENSYIGNIGLPPGEYT